MMIKGSIQENITIARAHTHTHTHTHKGSTSIYKANINGHKESTARVGNLTPHLIINGHSHSERESTWKLCP